RYYKFHSKLAESGYDFTELKEEVKTAALSAGRERIDELDAKMAGAGGEPSKLQKGLFWTSVGVGAAGLLTGIACTINGAGAYDFYLNEAGTVEDALKWHNRLEVYSWLQIVGYPIAAVGTAGALLTTSDGLFVGSYQKEKDEIADKLGRL
ncbi:MAG TPA: hypothetical protein DCO79_05945, partial [Spirochaeta sp.]|nr:hypothetical protein [Spirochaeta sp.]